MLFFTADDLNWDSVGAYGCPTGRITPNLDQFASEGIRFEHAHVNISSCMACRESILTGRYPHRNGAMGFDPIADGVPTLTEHLRRAGYYNAIIGKVAHYQPRRRFFWDRAVNFPGISGSAKRDPAYFYLHTTWLLAEAAAIERPFFLHVNCLDPHRPWPTGAPTDPNMPVGRTIQPHEVTVPGFLPDLPDIRVELARYYTGVYRLDRTFGAVMGALNESGRAADTIVIFLSDNGMAFPFVKTNCYESSTRTPLMVRWPGRVRGGSVDAQHMVSGVDLAPTILDALGLPAMPDLDGRSFVPVLRGQLQEGRDTVYTMFNRAHDGREFPMRCIRTKHCAYIFNAWSDGTPRLLDGTPLSPTMAAMVAAAKTDPAIAERVEHLIYRTPEEFYALQADPCELRNLIDDTSYRRKMHAMRDQLAEMMEATGDPLLPAFREQVAPAKLSWVGGADYTGTGCHPETGEAHATRFRFRVKVSDLNGNEPDFVNLRLRRNGKRFGEFTMVQGVGNFTEGRVYRVTRKLRAGNYEHCFKARDRDGLAVGPPTRWTRGPIVEPRTSVALTSLSAVAVTGGAQITFSLSSAAQVQARILNIASRPIKTLCRAKDCGAGTSSLLWNALSDQGLPVPNGTYLVEVIAKAADGTQARGLVQIRLER